MVLTMTLRMINWVNAKYTRALDYNDKHAPYVKFLIVCSDVLHPKT